jgi:predicted protein tyrosine phosphatase
VDIAICGRMTVAGLLVEDLGRRDLLVVSNPGAGLPTGVEGLARRLLHLEFDDQTRARSGVVLPTADDVRRALEWSVGYQRLVVCCHAGISRSSALAYVIACRDHPPEEALGVLSPRCHYPNSLIVRLGAIALGNEAVYTAFVGWLGREPVG